MAVLDEAAATFLSGELHVARLILRDLGNASAGFEGLAIETNRSNKSLHRVLSEKRHNLAAVFGVIGRRLVAQLKALCS